MSGNGHFVQTGRSWERRHSKTPGRSQLRKEFMCDWKKKYVLFLKAVGSPEKILSRGLR
jgi:hypothetical protein